MHALCPLPLLVAGSSLPHAKALEQLKLLCLVQVNLEEAELWKQLKQVRFPLLCWSAVAPVPSLCAPPEIAIYVPSCGSDGNNESVFSPAILSMRHSSSNSESVSFAALCVLVLLGCY